MCTSHTFTCFPKVGHIAFLKRDGSQGHTPPTENTHCKVSSLALRRSAISLNSQAGQQDMSARCYGQLVHILQKTRFTSFPSVYGCLSVHRHNVSPCFHNHCLTQLSLPTFKLLFLQQHVSTLRDTIVYRDIKIYGSNLKTLRLLVNLRPVSVMRFTMQPRNQATDRFKFVIDAQLNINIPISCLHQMQDVPGFRSAGRIYKKSNFQFMIAQANTNC